MPISTTLTVFCKYPCGCWEYLEAKTKATATVEAKKKGWRLVKREWTCTHCRDTEMSWFECPNKG